ncbi:MAG: DNA polymerase III subunit gamma/tau [Anaerolineae bacterium]|nr:DNA polymerase III subunit gamma/tau [Caldilineales bacterium]MCX7853497.1 DNA polymerase III subunit gamma/tau [Caldilineales bacterium]MDW8269902.1 DNA polymerase III subunit gamma/tau [Anaerolineae bacterium]
MQALYRRYRPADFDSLVGQEHITTTLRQALRQGRIGHAYLFTGPRGTGKTSSARILAKAVNCLAPDVAARPDNTCAICQAINEGRLLDLIEIDAASNTSVDDVRELRDRVAFAPTEARYKVYVIDEVHMLSTSAFNALLKTLEEPPPHVIFILATTEPHKIPATIISRCQRYDFHRLSTRLIADHLAVIAAREGLTVTPEALAIIARSATGSMRDAISLLDQITAYGHREIDAELVRNVLGMVSGEAVSRLAGAIADGDPARLLVLLHELIAQGVDLAQLVNQLIEHLRHLLLLNVGRDPGLLDLPDAVMEDLQNQARRFQAPQLLHAIRALNEAGLALKTPLAGYLPVELALLDAVGLGAVPLPAAAAPVSAPAVQPTPTPATPSAPAPAAQPASRPASPPPPAARPAPAEPPRTAPAELGSLWGQIITAMRPHSARLQAVLRSGTPVALNDDTLVIGFQYDFHREQIQGAIDLVARVAATVLGRPVSVQLVDLKREAAPPAAPRPEPKSTSRSAPPPSSSASSASEDPLLRTARELGATVTRLSPRDTDPST